MVVCPVCSAHTDKMEVLQNWVVRCDEWSLPVHLWAKRINLKPSQHSWAYSVSLPPAPTLATASHRRSPSGYKGYNISPHCTRGAVPLLRGSGQLSWVSPYSYTGHLCGCEDVLHLHHACTLFYREQEESLLNRIMTTKYLVTDYIAGQHDPDRNAMWSFARKPGYLWETVISHLWATAAPSPAVYQGSALSNQPGLSKYEGYGYNSRRVRGWQKLLYCKGLVPPCIPQPAVLLDLQRRLSMGLHHP